MKIENDFPGANEDDNIKKKAFVAMHQVIKVCQERLKKLPSVRNSLALASWHFQIEELAEAETVLHAALKREPKDASCWIGVAVTLLRKGDQTSDLAEAQKCLDQAQKCLKESRDSETQAWWNITYRVCLAEAAIQINHGANAKATSVNAPYEAPKPQMIEVPIYKAAIGEMHTNAIFLPSRSGDAPKPVVPISTPPPPPATEETNATLMKMLLEKLKEKEPKKRERSAVAAEGLTPSQQAAWDAYQWAIATEPTLAKANDPQIFAWLKDRPDCPHVTPPMQDTFRRYLSVARLHFDCRKRALTKRMPVVVELPPDGKP